MTCRALVSFFLLVGMAGSTKLSAIHLASPADFTDPDPRTQRRAYADSNPLTNYYFSQNPISLVVSPRQEDIDFTQLDPKESGDYIVAGFCALGVPASVQVPNK